MGKIAYGMRKNEKIEGNRNEFHVMKQDDFEIYDVPHTPLVSKEMWYACQEKRKEQGV